MADAAAHDGDHATATRALGASQTAIERSGLAPGESWASHFDIGRWAHHSGMILAQLGDFNGASEHLHQALEIHGLDRRRSRAIVLADLGQVQLRQGDPDAAFATWGDFVVCAEGIKSVKVHDAAQDMHARLRLYESVAEAQELRDRAARLVL
ncbi:tetratricopeptide repeat protein [Streptomyces sp. ISL-96]|uniref:tetratricopeptide repeat protein n=1 Tax=Streptomyces sp. ISL-96 TaxID=2819191 RepID=UPI0020352841|nr:tetratricopeptide repeat protein [Streptomyces sp. ISL-96]